eukprot:922679-Amorphochlora_amoeboformis.AAC.1
MAMDLGLPPRRLTYDTPRGCKTLDIKLISKHRETRTSKKARSWREGSLEALEEEKPTANTAKTSARPRPSPRRLLHEETADGVKLVIEPSSSSVARISVEQGNVKQQNTALRPASNSPRPQKLVKKKSKNTADVYVEFKHITPFDRAETVRCLLKSFLYYQGRLPATYDEMKKTYLNLDTDNIRGGPLAQSNELRKKKVIQGIEETLASITPELFKSYDIPEVVFVLGNTLDPRVVCSVAFGGLESDGIENIEPAGKVVTTAKRGRMVDRKVIRGLISCDLFTQPAKNSRTKLRVLLRFRFPPDDESDLPEIPSFDPNQDLRLLLRKAPHIRFIVHESGESVEAIELRSRRHDPPGILYESSSKPKLARVKW